MERVLSQDERIRRAEELYARRRMQKENNRSATVNVESNNSGSFRKKLIAQFIICAILYVIFIYAKNVPNLVPQDVLNKISDILEYDLNVQELYNKGINYFSPKEQNEENKSESEFKEETLSATYIADEEAEKINNTKPATEDTQEEIEEQEKFNNMSEMEKNALFVRTNISIIKPLTGEITSRFGTRESDNPIVSKFHTGIDIARITGTEVKAAIDGTVIESSGNGGYGNHIIIKNGEIATLYAHCSKLCVTEGETVVQGQTIAEVGATGNATGPHLHFEILRNGELIDPDLVLQF